MPPTDGACANCSWKADRGAVMLRLETADKNVTEMKSDLKALVEKMEKVRLDVKGLTVKIAVFSGLGGAIVAGLAIVLKLIGEF